MDDHVVSVLLPVYNGERYLRAAVDSVLSQTFTRFALLMVDDGSTDGSLEIMRGYAAQDPRVVVVTRENRGIVATLNELLERAQGRYIARMDADDIAHPDRFASQVKFLEEHPQVVLCGTAVVVIDESGLPLYRAARPVEHAEIERELLDGRCVITHPTVMARRDMVVAVGGYREEYRDVEDLDLFLRLAEVGRLANLPDHLLQYRVHADSVSTTRHLRQLELARKAASDARRRRGMDDTVAELGVQGDRAPDRQKIDLYRTRAWQSWNAGYRGTWRRYALKAVRHRPWSARAWKVLLIGATRRSPEAQR